MGSRGRASPGCRARPRARSRATGQKKKSLYAKPLSDELELIVNRCKLGLGCYNGETVESCLETDE